jgi:hypothetical protein
MPLDHGCRFDQHHGVEDLRPNPVEPHPQEPVCGEESNPTFVLPPQDAHLMSKGNELEFQGGAATKAEGEQRNEGGKNWDDAHDSMAVAQKSLGFLDLSEF